MLYGEKITNHDRDGGMEDMGNTRPALLLGMENYHQHVIIMMKYVTRRFIKENDAVMWCMVHISGSLG